MPITSTENRTKQGLLTALATMVFAATVWAALYFNYWWIAALLVLGAVAFALYLYFDRSLRHYRIAVFCLENELSSEQLMLQGILRH